MTVSAGAFRIIVLLFATLSSAACHAIDNPDAPDYLGQFRDKVSAYEQAIYQDSVTTSDSEEEYHRYIDFLEKELVSAKAAIKNELSEAEKLKLANSQTAWNAYKEAERDFITSVWTLENFGSSSGFSRLAFYAQVLTSRIELLLKYRSQF